MLALIPFGWFLILWVAYGDKRGNIQFTHLRLHHLRGKAPVLGLGVLSDLLPTNRFPLEEQLEGVKEMQYRRRGASPQGPAAEVGDLQEATNTVAV